MVAGVRARLVPQGGQLCHQTSRTRGLVLYALGFHRALKSIYTHPLVLPHAAAGSWIQKILHSKRLGI